MAKALFITGVGTAFWPKIAEKDREYDNYNTGLILSDKDFKPFKAALDEYMDGLKFAKVAKGKKPSVPYQEHLDDDGERIGWLIRAKSKYQPPVFDKRDRKIHDPQDEDSECPRIGGGTKMRMQVEFNAHDKGVNLYLKKIQIIDLKEYGSGFGAYDDGSDDGFGDGDESDAEDDTSSADDTPEEDLDI